MSWADGDGETDLVVASQLVGARGVSEGPGVGVQDGSDQGGGPVVEGQCERPGGALGDPAEREAVVLDPDSVWISRVVVIADEVEDGSRGQVGEVPIAVGVPDAAQGVVNVPRPLRIVFWTVRGLRRSALRMSRDAVLGVVTAVISSLVRPPSQPVKSEKDGSGRGQRAARSIASLRWWMPRLAA
ncbi:hypothetical protein GCM10011428_40420 [Streptomyces violaceus]